MLEQFSIRTHTILGAAYLHLAVVSGATDQLVGLPRFFLARGVAIVHTLAAGARQPRAKFTTRATRLRFFHAQLLRDYCVRVPCPGLVQDCGKHVRLGGG